MFPLKRVPLLTYAIDYEASWSPDGKQIILVSNRHGGMKLHILNADSQGKGSDVRQISYGEAEDDSPAWSPDGRQIAYVSVQNGASHVFVMNADGSQPHQLTREPGQNIHPEWSREGSRILFNTTHYASGAVPASPGERRVIGESTDDSMDLATIRPDASDLKRVTRGGGYTYASFSPDDKLILHRKQSGLVSQIFLMNSDGSDDHNLSGASSRDGWPSWSPDGERIVFSRHAQNRFQLYVMDRDGTNVSQLTDAEGEFTNPRWSPDGTKILCGRRLGGISLALFDAPK